MKNWLLASKNYKISRPSIKISKMSPLTPQIKEADVFLRLFLI